MYTVLLSIDTSEERARAQAEMAAELPDAAESVVVNLLHVTDDPEQTRDEAVTEMTAGKTASDRLEAAGVTTRLMARSGDPATEILAAAEDVNADQILLGGRKRSPLGSALFGSVSQEVMLDADRPVVVTGGRTETEMPTHRCQSCGEEYSTSTDVEISTCRNCGGAKVERIDDAEREQTPTA